MGKIAFIFPGQGAQAVGMGLDIKDKFEVSKDIFEQSDSLMDFSVSDTCFYENEDIHRTEYTQACLLTTSVALLKAVEQTGIKPDFVAGLSLGEYSALVANGTISFEDAIKIVRKRGQYMEAAAIETKGSMAAIIGSDEISIRNIIAKTDGYMDIANFNNSKQIVISGEEKAVEKAVDKFNKCGIRAVPLQVSGAFHSKLMESASEKLKIALDEVVLKTPSIPYFTNVSGEIVTDNREVKQLLVDQVSMSVRWEANIINMIKMGVDLFIEIGPGQTLKGIIKKIDRKVKVVNVSDSDSLDQLVSMMEERS